MMRVLQVPTAEGRLAPKTRSAHEMAVSGLGQTVLAAGAGSSCTGLCRGWTLLRLLQALGAAETAYAKAMTAISHVPLAAERDGDTLRAALNAFSDLPQAVAQTHSALQIGMGTITRSLHEVVTELRWDWGTLTAHKHRAASKQPGCCQCQTLLHGSSRRGARCLWQELSGNHPVGRRALVTPAGLAEPAICSAEPQGCWCMWGCKHPFAKGCSQKVVPCGVGRNPQHAWLCDSSSTVPLAVQAGLPVAAAQLNWETRPTHAGVRWSLQQHGWCWHLRLCVPGCAGGAAWSCSRPAQGGIMLLRRHGAASSRPSSSTRSAAGGQAACRDAGCSHGEVRVKLHLVCACRVTSARLDQMPAWRA